MYYYGMKKRFIRMLKHAYAAEYGAYLAYDGHWRSLKDPKEQSEVYDIMLVEFFHMLEVEGFLKELGETPSKWRNALFWIIGKTMSSLCFVTGRWAPMYGAAMIEKIGTNGYFELSVMAWTLDKREMSRKLYKMRQIEEEHEKYFLSKAGAK